MRPNDFRFLRVPKWVVILGVTGLILISITLVGLGFAAFQVGSQLVAVVRDAPAFISAGCGSLRSPTLDRPQPRPA